MATALLTQTEALAGRNVRHIMRDPTMLVDVVLSPVAFLLIFLATFQRLLDAQGIDYVQYLVPIIVIQALFFAAITASVAVATDVERGMLQRLRTLPLHHSAVLSGRLSADMARVIVSLAVLLALASAFGFRFEAGPLAAIGFIALTLLTALWLLASYTALGFYTGNAAAAQGAGLIPYAPLVLLSTGFVPKEAFPGWLQPIVANMPISKAADALRALSSGGPTARVVVEALAWSIPLAVFFSWLAVFTYRRAGDRSSGGGRSRGNGAAPADPEHAPIVAPVSLERVTDPAAVVAVRREGGPRRTFADLSHLTGRNVVINRRRPEELGYNLFFPIVILLTSVAAFSRVVFPDSPSDYANYVLPLTAVQAFSFASISTGVLMWEDRDRGILDRFRTLPIARSAALGARIWSDLMRALLQLVVLVLVGYAVGFRFENGVVSAIGFFLLPLAFAAWPLWLGVLLAFVVRSAEGIPAAVFPWLFPLTMFSTGFVPVDAFPGWLQPFAEANPFSAISDAMRALASGGELATPLWRTLAWSGGLAFIFGAVAVRAMRRRQA